jgi:hypothetical protein
MLAASWVTGVRPQPDFRRDRPGRRRRTRRAPPSPARPAGQADVVKAWLGTAPLAFDHRLTCLCWCAWNLARLDAGIGAPILGLVRAFDDILPATASHRHSALRRPPLQLLCTRSPQSFAGRLPTSPAVDVTPLPSGRHPRRSPSRGGSRALAAAQGDARRSSGSGRPRPPAGDRPLRTPRCPRLPAGDRAARARVCRAITSRFSFFALTHLGYLAVFAGGVWPLSAAGFAARSRLGGSPVPRRQQRTGLWTGSLPDVGAGAC